MLEPLRMQELGFHSALPDAQREASLVLRALSTQPYHELERQFPSQPSATRAQAAGASLRRALDDLRFADG